MENVPDQSFILNKNTLNSLLIHNATPTINTFLLHENLPRGQNAPLSFQKNAKLSPHNRALCAHLAQEECHFVKVVCPSPARP